MKKIEILGIGITQASREEILEYIFTSLEKEHTKHYLVTPNPEMLVLAQKDFSFKKILNNAFLSLCDGAGLLFAAQILGKGRLTRFTGVELVEEVCKRSVKEPVSIGFLGGRHGVAERSAECLRRKYPGLKIDFIFEEWPENGGGVERIDILFVAFGFPKQEKWIAENLVHLPVKMIVGVGGAFDYLSGRVVRAPIFLRRFGLEWLFRLLREPWRWKRQLALVKFVFLVFKERFL